MSSGNRNTEQAERLLRALGEIDDRFLMEAMAPEEAEEYSGQTQTQQNQPQSDVRPEAQPAEERTRTPGRRRLRRYSAWALTAAACLTVVVIGRFVSVNQVSTEKEQPTAIVKEEQAEEAVRDAGSAEADGEILKAEDSAAPAASDSAVQEASGSVALEASDKAAVEMADSAAPEEAQMEAAEDSAQEAEAPEVASNTAGASALVTMPNPFVETKTLEEACKKAGFSLTLPKEEEPCEKIFRVMPGQMIEVIYLAEDSRELLRIRKGKDMSEDISGVYEKYAVSEVLDPDGMNIAVSGDKEDSWEVACWTQIPEEDCLYSYSITTQRDALTGEEIIRMAEEMMAES
jgi:hypothetical protein